VSARQASTRDGGVAHATTAEDRDRVAAADLAGEHGGTEAGHHAAAEEPGHLRLHVGRDLGALAGGDQRLLGEGADAQCRRQLGAVEGHLLRGVEGGEAVPGAAPATGPALAAHRSPVEDHEVAGSHLDHIRTDRLDDPGRLVPEQEREVVVDPALPIVQVGVAHTAGLDLHQRLAGPGVRDHDRLDGDGLLLRSGDDAPDLVCHGPGR
jgi:hypothetical protein